MGSVLSHRVHFFEIHDTWWCPTIFRNYLTEYLLFSWHFCNYYTLVVPVLSRALRDSGSSKIVDLCSGSGGPLPAIQEALKKKENVNVSIQLTDLFPHVESFEQRKKDGKSDGFEVNFSPESVDATNCKEEGFRTLFASFHHFQPELAQKILQNAVDTNNPIAIFEATERSAFNILFFSIIFLLLTPIVGVFARPRFALARFFWSTIIPIMPFVMAWDGAVSCLRTYSPNELRELVESLDHTEKFCWQIGYVKPWLFPNLIYLIGIPREQINIKKYS